MNPSPGKGLFPVLLVLLVFSSPFSFSKAESAAPLSFALQGADGETLSINNGQHRSGTIPPPPPGSCLLSPVQYQFSVPDSECEPIDLLFTPTLRANQNVRLYVRFGQRVSLENGVILADFAVDSGDALERRVDLSVLSDPALRAGDYFVAISNCGPEAASFTINLNRGFVDFFAPIRVISRAEVDGKRLLVYGCFPKKGAVLLLNGLPRKHTLHDEERRRGLVISKKAGAQIAPGQTVTIQLQFPGNILSNVLMYTRPLE